MPLGTAPYRLFLLALTFLVAVPALAEAGVSGALADRCPLHEAAEAPTKAWIAPPELAATPHDGCADGRVMLCCAHTPVPSTPLLLVPVSAGTSRQVGVRPVEGSARTAVLLFPAPPPPLQGRHLRVALSTFLN